MLYYEFKNKVIRKSEIPLFPLFSTCYKSLSGKEILPHLVQVTSFGGAGTTLLLNFLSFLGIRIPMGEKHYEWKWKHLRMPPGCGVMSYMKPRKGFKAVYLISNPMNVIISLFGRKLHHIHLKSMGIENKVMSPNLTLEEYLDRGEDIFLIEEQFKNWTECPKDAREYPIMIIRYEYLWENVQELFDFLDIPPAFLKRFPNKVQRSSDWEKQPPGIQKKLLNIYGGLYKRVENFPQTKII